MPIEIKLPAVIAGMTEGVVARWLKAPGDAIAAGETIAEVETDKAVLEITADAAGVLGRILVEANGIAVPVGTPIGLVLLAGESAAALEGAGGAQSKPPVAAPPRAAPAASTPAAGRVFASPLARRLAVERGMELGALQGSGPHGRIVRLDVERAGPSATAAAVPLTAPGGYTEQPLSQMRKAIARRLTEAKQSVPHFYLGIDCELDRLQALRAEMTAAGKKISLNDCIVRAVALALRQVPAANAAWAGDAIRFHHDVDIAVAVATPKGLLTPVLRRADAKPLSVLARELKTLAERARDGKLKPEDYQGGGFTISNLGMYGVREFAAIINPPQACILAVGAAERRPVVRGEAIVAATVMSCTLSVDHRAVDGAVGAQFLAAFRQLIEAPLSLLKWE
ncbi:MAG: dihydrolipoamide acetyltransferase family protein [Rhodocyclales bacterium]|nr:dihydrolipoamide acetyltransferase family protein [Rhodocyclales bacterium]